VGVTPPDYYRQGVKRGTVEVNKNRLSVRFSSGNDQKRGRYSIDFLHNSRHTRAKGKGGVEGFNRLGEWRKDARG